jgi:hypothetical protein
MMALASVSAAEPATDLFGREFGPDSGKSGENLRFMRIDLINVETLSRYQVK